MKWFKHDTDTSADPKIKLLKSKFGVEGVGVYFEINRLIAQNVEDDTEEWGYLPKEYTDYPELLAEEIGIQDVQKMTTICTFCVEKKLLYKINGRIANPKILLRADRYTEKKAREKSLNLDEYVKNMYILCTQNGHSVTDKKRIEKKRKEKNILATNVAENVVVKDPLNELINLFQPVNPSYERLFVNKTQRSALQRMVDKYGSDKIGRAIQVLPETNNQPYAPIITTPIELEKKMGNLVAFLNKQKANTRSAEFKEAV